MLNARHRKLLIMRAAMQDAQRGLQHTTERYWETQRRAIELASSLEHLQQEKKTTEELEKFLRKAIDNVSRLHTEVRHLSEFFEFMSNTLSILLETVTQRFLANIKSGISDKSIDFGLSYGQAQKNIIRQTVLSLRGQITFIIESTRLYRGISTQFIMPSIRMAASLPLEASVQQQDDFKKELKLFTNGCADKIMILATEEYEKTSKQLGNGVMDVDEEMLALPAQPDHIHEAIDEGIKDASRQKQEQFEEIKKANLPLEINDDILG
ncbi:MAG: hypothetical protein Q9218_005194 [Villophora microphyllina]